MKMVFYLGLFLAASLFSFGQTAEKKAPAAKGEQKKEQHVKVMISQNGKVVKIDTTFNFADEKVVKFKVDSILKTHGVDDSGTGEHNVIVIREGKNMHPGHHPGGSMPGEKQISVFYEINDSNAVKGEKRVIWHDKGGYVTKFDGEGEMIPLPPPPPPAPGMPGMYVRSFKMHGGDPFAMDPNDQDIVTYDRKDIGKGLEKITIVRKKRPENKPPKEVEVQVEVKEETKK